MSLRFERIFTVPVALPLAGQFVVLGALWPVLPVDPDISMRYAILCVAVASGLTLLFSAHGGGRVLALGVIFATLSALVPILAKGYDSIFLTMVLSAMLGYLAYRYCLPPKIHLWLIGGLFFYLIAYYLRHGQLDEVFYYYGTDDTMAGVSRNYVGILLLQQYLVYYASCVRRNSRPQHWPLFVMPIIAVMTSGVGSTLVTVLALFGYLLHQLRLRLIHGVAIASAVVILATTSLGWLEGTLLFERLTSGQFVISRLLLWTDFADKMNGTSIWIGLPKDTGFIDHEVSLNEIHNLHNSYLNLYKGVGAFSLPYYVLVAYTAITLLRRHAMLGWLFFCALLRAATDGYFFSSFLIDFILFFLFFLTPLGERLLLVRSSRKAAVCL